MFTSIRGFFAGTLMSVALFAAPAAASSIDFTNAAFAPVNGPTSTPIGAAEFCKTHRDDCGPNIRPIEAATLTETGWQMLIAVNDHVNATVKPVTDADFYKVAEYWTYPVGGEGDCEDFALEKRRLLIANGWDASTLLMTVVRQANGEGHAVLMVRTDRGDLVLDNQDGRVLLWTETPYEYVKRQSQTDSRKWVGLTDFRAPLYTAGH